jgi:hypothetical protein
MPRTTHATTFDTPDAPEPSDLDKLLASNRATRASRRRRARRMAQDQGHKLAPAATPHPESEAGR